MTNHVETINNLMDIGTGKRPIYTREPRIVMNFYATPALHDQIQETAKECGTSMSEFCGVAVKFYLEHLETAQ